MIIKKFLFTLIFLKLLIILLLLNQGQCDDIEYKLVHSLLDNYDPGMRPTENHNHSINVTIGLALTQIIDIVSSYKNWYRGKDTEKIS